MGWNCGTQPKNCRWCGKLYYACQPVDRDGFCKPSHKQAHYRAYKKWVTAISAAAPGPADQRVTRKTRKKKGKRDGKVKKNR